MFLQDTAHRALVHPAPTPTRCYLATDGARVMFDAHADESPAQDVPAEAHRRLRADLRVRNGGRPHASLGPGIPDGAALSAVSTDGRIPDGHRVLAKPILGGLHHEYRLELAA